MNDYQFDDLKQFIDSKVSQSELGIKEYVDIRVSQSESGLKKYIDTRASRTETKVGALEDKVDTGFASIAEIAERLIDQVDDHETKIVKLETKPR